MFQVCIGWLDRKFYPDVDEAWDRAIFQRRMLEVLKPEMRILDLGAGRGKSDALDFRDHCSFVAGADVDDVVMANPFLHEAKRIVDGEIPYEDESFDLVFSYDVLEHVTDPPAFFREAARVLKPGGIFLAKTPNKRHYVALLARILPERCHRWIHRLRGRREQDTFPTVYRCNTQRALSGAASASRLELEQIEFVESRPNYLKISTPTFLLGILYERIVNSTTWLRQFRCIIIVKMRRARSATDPI